MSNPTIIQKSTSPKDPAVALLLNLFLAGGGGYLYIGQTTKGVVVIIVTLILLCFGIGFFIPFLTCIDAYQLAQKLKSGQSIGEWEFFWSQSTPKAQPSQVYAPVTDVGPETIRPRPPIPSTQVIAAPPPSTTLTLNEQTSTDELIAVFKKDINSIGEILQPPDSERAGQILISRGAEVLPNVFPLLDDKDFSVRFITVKLLHSFDDPQVATSLLKVIKTDFNENCRFESWKSLVGRCTPEVAGPIVEAMRDYIREMKRMVSFKRNEAVAGSVLNLVFGGGGGGVAGSIAGGFLKAAVRYTMTDFEKKSPEERFEAYTDAFDNVLMAAQPFFIDPLLASLADKDSVVAAFMLLRTSRPLRWVEDEEQRKRLINGVIGVAYKSPPDLTLRQMALGALLKANTRETRNALRQIAQNSDPIVKSWALAALEKGIQEAEQNLRFNLILHHDPSTEQNDTEGSITEVTRTLRKESADLRRKVVSGLVAATSDEDTRLRQVAFEELAKAKAAEAVEALQQLCQSDNDEIREMALKAVQSSQV